MPDDAPYGFWSWMRDNMTRDVMLAVAAAASVGFGSCNAYLNTRNKDRLDEVEQKVDQHAEVISRKADDAAVNAEKAADVVTKTNARVKNIEAGVNDLWMEGVTGGVAPRPEPKKDAKTEPKKPGTTTLPDKDGDR